MASTRLAETLNPGGKGAKNSLLLYLLMINLSFSSWVDSGRGLGPFSFCSQILLAMRLPKADMTARWPGGHSSRSRERTLDMCEPSLRWTPEHSMQIKTPRLILAQSGSVIREINEWLKKKCYVDLKPESNCLPIENDTLSNWRHQQKNSKDESKQKETKLY